MANNRVISAVLTLKDKDFSANAKKATGATTDLERRMKSAKGSIKDFGKSAANGMKNVAKGVGIAGAAAVGFGVAAFAATKKVAEGFDKVAKNSKKLGVSTDAYQEMDYWAGQNGISSDNMEKAVGRLNQRIGEAAGGNKKYSSALTTLGVDMKGVKKGTVSTEDAMAQSIQGLSKMTNEQEKAAMASELFGTKLGRELMPSLQDGSLSLEDAAKKAKELGIVIDEDSLKSAEKFSDTWDNLTRGVQAFGKKAIAGVMPFFQNVMDFAIAKLPVVQSAFSTVFGAVSKVIGWLGDKGTYVFNRIKDAISDNKPVIDNLKGGLVKVGEAAIAVKDWAVDAFKNIKERIKENSPALEGVKSVMEDMGEKAIELKDWMIDAFESAKPALEWLKDEGLPLVVDGIAELVEKATELYNYIDDKWNAISPIVYGVAGAVLFYKAAIVVATVATKIWAGVTKGLAIAQGIFNAVLALSPLGWLAIGIGVVVAIGIVLWKNWDTISEKAGNLWATIKEKFGEMKEKVVTWFGDMKDGAGEKFEGIVQAAKDLPGKIGKGIKDYIGDATSAMADLAEGLIDKFKSALGINSPSTVFFGMAKWIVKGLTNGLNVKNLKALGKNVFKDFAGGALNTLDSIKGFFTGGGSGGTAGLSGQAIAQGLASKYGLRITSGYRPGAVTSAGTPSDHATGNAYDLGGSSDAMWQAALEAQKNPDVKYVINRNMWSQNGGPWEPFPWGGHMDHTHISLKGKKKNGGQISSSGRYLTGEKGPELIDLPAGSKVHNAQNSKKMSDSGGNIINININGVNKSVNEIINELVPALQMRLANI